MHNDSKLSNNLQILSETMESVETVSLGVYVGTGARLEKVSENGVSHFLEHMAFKGTKTRTAMDIAAEIENVGGQMNAYTSYESTAYYVKVLKEDVELAMDILADILQNSTFPDDEIERERDVILQEISQSIDAPDDYVFELAQETVWGDNPMGRPILGSTQTVKSINKKMLTDYMDNHYHAGNMLICAAGNIDHKTLHGLADKYFGHLPNKGSAPTFSPAPFVGGLQVNTRALEQQHLNIIWPAVHQTHPDYYTSHVWATILGGGMSSRLFQEIREKRGLVYNIYSYMQSYDQTGIFGIYAACSPLKVAELIPATEACIAETLNSLDDDEVSRAKAQLKASLLMSQESTTARMSRLAANQTVYGKYIPLAETVRRIDNISKADIVRVGKAILESNKRAVCGVGSLSEADMQKITPPAA